MPDGQLADIVSTLAITLASLVALARFILWYMEKAVNRTMTRNETLETRMEKFEADLETERQGHLDCRRELNDHRIEAAASLAYVQAKVDTLEAMLNRPYRSTDLAAGRAPNDRGVDPGPDDVPD